MRIIRLEWKKYFRPVRLLLVLALLGCFCFAVSESQRKALSLTDTASYPDLITTGDTLFKRRSLDLLFSVSDKLVFDWGDLMENRCTPEKAIIDVNGISLLAAPSQESEAFTPEKMQQMLLTLDDRYDFILIDAPAGIAEEFRLAAACAEYAIVVATADDVCLRSAYRAAEKLRISGPKQLRLVLNRFHAPAMEHNFLHNIDDAIDRVGVQLIGVVPDDFEVLFRLPKGEPLPKKSTAKSAYLRIARRLCGERVALKIQ